MSNKSKTNKIKVKEYLKLNNREQDETNWSKRKQAEPSYNKVT